MRPFWLALGRSPQPWRLWPRHAPARLSSVAPINFRHCRLLARRPYTAAIHCRTAPGSTGGPGNPAYMQNTTLYLYSLYVLNAFFLIVGFYLSFKRRRVYSILYGGLAAFIIL